jgi:hypothetical protein
LIALLDDNGLVFLFFLFVIHLDGVAGVAFYEVIQHRKRNITINKWIKAPSNKYSIRPRTGINLIFDWVPRCFSILYRATVMLSWKDIPRHTGQLNEKNREVHHYHEKLADV